MIVLQYVYGVIFSPLRPAEYGARGGKPGPEGLSGKFGSGELPVLRRGDLPSDSRSDGRVIRPPPRKASL